MRVIHFIPDLFGGGAERQLSYLATEQVKSGIDVHVAFLHPGPNLERLIASGATLHRLSAMSNHDPMLLWKIWRLIRQTLPDIVQTWMRQMDVLGGIAARIAGVPWILSERASARAYPPGFKHGLRRLVASRAQAIVCNSLAGDRYWDTALGGRVPRLVVRNGLPLNEIDEAAAMTFQKKGETAHRKLVLFAGRFSRERNLRSLLPALRSVLAAPERLGMLCGEGPERAWVENYMKNHGLSDRISLPGYVREPELWCRMKRADVFVSVSLNEGHPNGVLEAIVCECPLVVSDIPEHREFLGNETALLVNPLDPDGIARAIDQVLKDPNSARERAARARQIARTYSLSSMASKYANCYRQLTEREGNRGEPA